MFMPWTPQKRPPKYQKQQQKKSTVFFNKAGSKLNNKGLRYFTVTYMKPFS